MSTLIRSAIIALVLAAGASSAMAASEHNYGWRDWSKPYGGYSPNSQEGARAFWDYQAQHGN